MTNDWIEQAYEILQYRYEEAARRLRNHKATTDAAYAAWRKGQITNEFMADTLAHEAKTCGFVVADTLREMGGAIEINARSAEPQELKP